MKHIVCFSGGHSSALVAVEVARKYGRENVILLNHDINSKKEDADIKRFKAEISMALQIPITYANINGITDPDNIPNQFEVCLTAGAFTSPDGNALCTALLKTIPFYKFLADNFPVQPTFWQEIAACTIYYGFDKTELTRVQRRTGILGAMGYKSDYPLFFWQNRTIHDTREIGIEPPLCYNYYEHANCKGCLKASILHWYVTFVHEKETYAEGIFAEDEFDFTIHTITRKGQKIKISLTELIPFFERMMADGIPATEHQSKIKFANMLAKYQLEECTSGLSCECIA